MVYMKAGQSGVSLLPGLPRAYFSISPRDLLLNCLSIGLGKQREESAAEVVGVAIRVPQLVGYCIQEQVTSWEEGVSTQVMGRRCICYGKKVHMLWEEGAHVMGRRCKCKSFATCKLYIKPHCTTQRERKEYIGYSMSRKKDNL